MWLFLVGLFFKDYHWQWARDFWEKFYGLVALEDGGAIAVGEAPTLVASGSGAIILRIDALGNPVWSLGAYRDDVTAQRQLVDACLADDGYLWAVGWDGVGWDWAMALKVDTSNGNLIFAKHIGGTGDKAMGVARGSGGSVILGGSLKNGNYAFVGKLDATGNLLWSKVWGDGSTTTEAIYRVLKLSNDNYLLVGNIQQPVSSATDGNAVFVAKIDENGNVIWSKVFDIPLNSDAWGAAEGVDGYFVLATSGTYDFWLLKLDYSGNLLWAKGYDTPVSGRTYLAATPDSGLLFLTNSGSYTSRGWLLVKVSQVDGSILWASSWSNGVLYALNDPYAAAAVGNELLVVGQGNRLTSTGYDHALILKIGLDGLYSGCFYSYSVRITDAPPDTVFSFNPFRDTVLPVVDYTYTTVNLTPVVTNICEPLFQETEEEPSSEEFRAYWNGKAVRVALSQASSVEFAVYEPGGRLVSKWTRRLPSGIHLIPVPGKGVRVVRVKVSEKTKTLICFSP